MKNPTLPFKIAGLATAYAALLAYIERRYLIKPDHTWAEVAGGVLITLVPVAIEARHQEPERWQDYESAVFTSFIASGAPIILWQLGEALYRNQEILAAKGAHTYDTISPLAQRSARVSTDHYQECDQHPGTYSESNELS
jgi:hypothetical protein